MTAGWREIGDRVFVRRHRELDLNCGLVVGDGGCLVIDTRSHLGEGRALAEAVRTVTPHQRRALLARDGGCPIPGCTAQAAWLDGHHVTAWSAGGASDLDNYALLCERHHTWVHERNLTAVVTAHGVLWLLR